MQNDTKLIAPVEIVLVITVMFVDSKPQDCALLLTKKDGMVLLKLRSLFKVTLV
jgi:hypothetical protein